MAKWSEQFGLINDDGLCVVTLGQGIDTSNWSSKDSVKEAVFGKVKQILEYKQQKFDAKRIMVK